MGTELQFHWLPCPADTGSSASNYSTRDSFAISVPRGHEACRSDYGLENAEGQESPGKCQELDGTSQQNQLIFTWSHPQRAPLRVRVPSEAQAFIFFKVPQVILVYNEI